jgi:hypothetical protein
VFCLQHRDTKAVYFGTGWDLSEVMREQLGMVRANTHPDKRMNGLPDPTRVEFIVVSAVLLTRQARRSMAMS